MNYCYKVVYPTTAFLAEAGYAKVAHLPCIFDSRPGYHRVGSQFLIDRGLGYWDPKHRGKVQLPIPPTAISMKNYADRLANFLEWCDRRGLDPLMVEYSCDLIGRYQQEMLKGIWSANNRRLSENTINQRIETAIDFATWAADKGLRAEFTVPKITRTHIAHSAFSSVGHELRHVEVREGKLREPKRRLGFPSVSEINAWLSRVYAKPITGTTEGLICETILETALRREEAACLRVDSLPLKKSDWIVPNPEAAPENQAVLVKIKYGVKGKEYGRDHGTKIGPVGVIRMPMPLALKLHEYRKIDRANALTIAIQKGRTLAEQRMIRSETVNLFLDPLTGRQFTGAKIYETWRSVERPKGWCPHLARDFWACSLLWRRMEAQRKLLELALRTEVDKTTLQALQMNAQSVIELEIQPQLRHKSPDTTLIYLQWLSDKLNINLNLHQNLVDELENNGDEVEC